MITHWMKCKPNISGQVEITSEMFKDNLTVHMSAEDAMAWAESLATAAATASVVFVKKAQQQVDEATLNVIAMEERKSVLQDMIKRFWK